MPPRRHRRAATPSTRSTRTQETRRQEKADEAEVGRRAVRRAARRARHQHRRLADAPARRDLACLPRPFFSRLLDPSRGLTADFISEPRIYAIDATRYKTQASAAHRVVVAGPRRLRLQKERGGPPVQRDRPGERVRAPDARRPTAAAPRPAQGGARECRARGAAAQRRRRAMRVFPASGFFSSS